MPATPAWPPKSLPRLFVAQPLGEGGIVELDASQANYLGNVLRLRPGAELLLFDGQSGEWLGRINDASRKRMTVSVAGKTREPESIPDVWLAFAPVKRAQTDWLVEKATELGTARLLPVITQRTNSERVKLDRLRSIAIEAAEQCGRTVLPEIAKPQPLADFLKGLDRPLYFADENGGGDAMQAFEAPPAAILIGPEGGFTEEERAAIRAHDRAVAISLGPRILRAETAALAALATYMANAGDWHP
jgi:16S rRNA (uracil1498-N3)-methyltransferase